MERPEIWGRYGGDIREIWGDMRKYRSGPTLTLTLALALALALTLTVLRDGLEYVLQVLGLGAHVEQVKGEPDIREIHGRCSGATRELYGRYRGDIGEINGRYRSLDLVLTSS